METRNNGTNNGRSGAARPVPPSAQIRKNAPPRNANSDKHNDVRQSSVQQRGTAARGQRPVQNAALNGKVGADLRKKQRLTQEQIERIMRERKMQKQAILREKLEYLGSLAVIFLIAFSILAAIFASAFFINLKAYKAPDNSVYKLVLSDYDSEKEVKLGSIVGEDGLRYYNFSQIAEFFGFAMIGSIDNMKYIVKGSESETLSFYPERESAHVNDVFVRTDGKSFYKDGDLFVCESFIRDNVLGLKIENDSDEKSVNISRILLNSVDGEGKINDGRAPEYEEIAFALKAPSVMTSIAEDDSAVSVPTFTFAADLSSYEEYINPGSTTEFLTLVNKEHILNENYIPTGLTKLSYGEGMQLKDYAANAFEAMMLEANACGIVGLTATNAYVSYSDTLAKFNSIVDEHVTLLGRDGAKIFASEMTHAPGTDEHQTGLAVDLGLTSGMTLEGSTAYSWLLMNCEKFGFILRYPKDKADSAGGIYNPTQFRYVGRYHAVRINDLGMSLEEYCAYLGL